MEAEIVEIGDIVAFNVASPYDRIGPSPVIHRVVSKWVENGIVYFRTKGDRNPISDPYDIPANNILGKYAGIRLPYVVLLFLFIKSPMGLALVILIAVLSIMSDHVFRRR